MFYIPMSAQCAYIYLSCPAEERSITENSSITVVVAVVVLIVVVADPRMYTSSLQRNLCSCLPEAVPCHTQCKVVPGMYQA